MTERTVNWHKNSRIDGFNNNYDWAKNNLSNRWAKCKLLMKVYTKQFKSIDLIKIKPFEIWNKVACSVSKPISITSAEGNQYSRCQIYVKRTAIKYPDDWVHRRFAPTPADFWEETQTKYEVESCRNPAMFRRAGRSRNSCKYLYL